MSNVSTRAVVNSAWESGAANSSSSRESAQQGARIGQHLNRLHKKAQDQETSTRRQSVMSDMTHPSSSFNSSSGGARRASDPGRVLDRNFGVNGQLSRHRSGSYAGQQENSGYQVIFTLLSTWTPMFTSRFLSTHATSSKRVGLKWSLLTFVTLLFCSFLLLLIHLLQQQLLQIKVTNSTRHSSSLPTISKTISIMELGLNSMGFLRAPDLATITMASMLEQHQVLLLNRIGTTNNGIIGIIMVPTIIRNPPPLKPVLTSEL